VKSDEYKAVLSEEDQKIVEDAAADGSKWIDENADATKDEIEAKLKDIRGRAQEIMDRAKAKIGEQAPAAESSSTNDETATSGEEVPSADDEF
jgi:hypothetical protein